MAENCYWSGPPHALPAEHRRELPIDYQNNHLGNGAGTRHFTGRSWASYGLLYGVLNELIE